LKFLSVLSMFPVFLGAATYQATAPSVPARLAADRLVRDGALLRGQGHARATVGGLVFQADEAILDSASGEVELRGHVQIALPGRADHSVFRFAADGPSMGRPGAIVTDKPVGLTAGRMTIRNGVLQASGNLVVRAADAQVRGDEMWMVLRTADATLRGHIVTFGKATHEGELPEIPPEIVK
jgi:hypothetical protein